MTTPSDQPARDAIVECLDKNIVVEAGAGTGKTTSLVGRIVTLITTGKARVNGIAAITFTEAAASELRERIREKLEKAAVDPDRDPEERQRCESAVHDLDQAAIQTLHSFAGSLLREHPLEAGLPPGFDIRDEIEADIAFDRRWSEWLDETLDDPEAQEALRPALKTGMTLGHLREIADKFRVNYDLLPSIPFRVPCISEEETPAASLAELWRLSSFAKSHDDTLFVILHDMLRFWERLMEAGENVERLSELRNQVPSTRVGNKGRLDNWDTDPESGENACKVIRELLPDVGEAIQAKLDAAREAVLAPVLELLRRFVLGYAKERRIEGKIEFQDLLVLARDMLRDDLGVRDYFQHRYTHILIDEVQDTDPLQAEIAMFLAEDAPDCASSADRHDWLKVRPAPGKLFIVGDPKQSIYRFRRADIEQVKRLQQAVGGASETLKQNFRSLPPVIDCVNHVFRRWMAESDGQPKYICLDAKLREDASPSVRYIGGEIGGVIGEVRRRETEVIANTIRTAVDDGWQVRSKDDGSESRRAAYRDICILMPARTGLPTLELALEDADVPYRLETPSLVYATQEIQDLLNCLSAIDDPTDHVSVVAALRSPAFACSDVDLLEFVEAGGQFDYLAEGAAPPGYVSEALAVLKAFHDRRRWLSPAALIEEFLRERRLMELALDDSRPRERWRRYRFLLERAQAFALAREPSLRSFIEWAGRQREKDAVVRETPIPESDEDAVRVMTIHGAKGLEFPILILTGLNADRRHRPGAALFDRADGSVEVRVGVSGSYFQTSGYDRLAEDDKRRDEEEFVRLMYVAATRARDHLIVSLYRTEKDTKSAAARIEKFMECAGQLWERFDPPKVEERPSPDSPAAIGNSDADTSAARDQWEKERTRVYAAQSRPFSVAATRLAKEKKNEQDVPDEPWRRGRAGTSIGRAVHAVLQVVDLETGRGLEDIAKAQAAAEGVPGRADDISRLARRAIDSPLVKRALESGLWWRETPVAGPVGDGIVEGFIDLLFEEEGGLVIVDYKTDTLGSDDEIERAMARYRLQGGGYALALSKATGLKVKEVSFLFLEPNREVSVDGLSGAMREAEEAALALFAG